MLLVLCGIEHITEKGHAIENFWITKKMGVFLCCVKLEILQPQGQSRTAKNLTIKRLK